MTRPSGLPVAAADTLSQPHGAASRTRYGRQIQVHVLAQALELHAASRPAKPAAGKGRSRAVWVVPALKLLSYKQSRPARRWPADAADDGAGTSLRVRGSPLPRCQREHPRTFRSTECRYSGPTARPAMAATVWMLLKPRRQYRDAVPGWGAIASELEVPAAKGPRRLSGSPLNRGRMTERASPRAGAAERPPLQLGLPDSPARGRDQPQWIALKTPLGARCG